MTVSSMEILPLCRNRKHKNSLRHSDYITRFTPVILLPGKNKQVISSTKICSPKTLYLSIIKEKKWMFKIKNYILTQIMIKSSISI